MIEVIQVKPRNDFKVYVYFVVWIWVFYKTASSSETSDV